jgi:hypothetical protein
MHNLKFRPEARKRETLHLNMLSLVVEFALKIEMAISKNRTTHLHF